MRKSPSDGQSFKAIRSENLVYVDKTKYLHELAARNGCCLLSRPCGFGKSLLLGAMRELLSGERGQFKGLWIDSSDYDFKKCPAVHLSMAGACDGAKTLEEGVMANLSLSAEENGLDPPMAESPGDMLIELAETLKSASGQPF